MVQLATLQPEPVVELPKAPGRLLLGHTDKPVIHLNVILPLQGLITVDRAAEVERTTGLPKTQVLVLGSGILHQFPLLGRP